MLNTTSDQYILKSYFNEYEVLNTYLGYVSAKVVLNTFSRVTLARRRFSIHSQDLRKRMRGAQYVLNGRRHTGTQSAQLQHIFPSTRKLPSPAASKRSVTVTAFQDGWNSHIKKLTNSVSLLHRYAFITSMTLFLYSGRNLLFRLISHPIYGAAILLNPFNLLLALYPLSVANVLTCLLTIFCVFFLSTLYPHFCYISISPSPNLPHLSECDSNPRKIHPIFATLSSVLKNMAGTIRTKRCIEVCRRMGSHYFVKTKRGRKPRWGREIQHKQSCNAEVLPYRSAF